MPSHSQASRSSHAGAKSACRTRRNTPASSRPGAAPARAAPRCAATRIRAAPCWRSAAADPPVGGRRPPQPACRRGRRLIGLGSLQPRSDTNAMVVTAGAPRTTGRRHDRAGPRGRLSRWGCGTCGLPGRMPRITMDRQRGMLLRPVSFGWSLPAERPPEGYMQNFRQAA
jgi:hypothetical protein